MILKSSLCFCVGTLLLTALCVKSDNHAHLDDRSLIGQLLDRVNALEERDAIHQKLIADLQDELSNQKKDIGRMKQSLAARDRRIWSLLRSMRRRDVFDNHEKQRVKSEYSDNDHPSKQEGPAVRRIRQAENEVTVAFSAALSKTMSNPGTHQNIVFDHVFTNLGNGYNAHQGVFLAPVSGTYVLFTTIHALHNHDIWCQFVVNGIHKSSVYAQSMNFDEDESSQTIILQLKQGDDVSIQLVRGTVEIHGTSSYPYTTFSGFLLQQDYSQPGNIIG